MQLILGHAKAAEELIKKGSDVNHKGTYGDPILLWVVNGGNSLRSRKLK